MLPENLGGDKEYLCTTYTRFDRAGAEHGGDKKRARILQENKTGEENRFFGVKKKLDMQSCNKPERSDQPKWFWSLRNCGLGAS